MEGEAGRREGNKAGLAHRLVHDGNLSAAAVLATSLALGLALGFALPTDDSLPGAPARPACLSLPLLWCLPTWWDAGATVRVPGRALKAF